MNKSAVNGLLLIALAAPVVLFLLLLSNVQLNIVIAGMVAVVAGWALNVVWAIAAQKNAGTDQPRSESNYFSIATKFGWACPTVFVLLAWVVWRLVLGRTT